MPLFADRSAMLISKRSRYMRMRSPTFDSFIIAFRLSLKLMGYYIIKLHIPLCDFFESEDFW